MPDNDINGLDAPPTIPNVDAAASAGDEITITKSAITKALMWIVGIAITGLISLLVWAVSSIHSLDTRQTKTEEHMNGDNKAEVELKKSYDKQLTAIAGNVTAVSNKVTLIVNGINQMKIEDERKRYEQLKIIVDALQTLEKSTIAANNSRVAMIPDVPNSWSITPPNSSPAPIPEYMFEAVKKKAIEEELKKSLDGLEKLERAQKQQYEQLERSYKK